MAFIKIAKILYYHKRKWNLYLFSSYPPLFNVSEGPFSQYINFVEDIIFISFRLDGNKVWKTPLT